MLVESQTAWIVLFLVLVAAINVLLVNSSKTINVLVAKTLVVRHAQMQIHAPNAQKAFIYRTETAWSVIRTFVNFAVRMAHVKSVSLATLSTLPQTNAKHVLKGATSALMRQVVCFVIQRSILDIDL